MQTPQTELDHYHWFNRCPGADDRTIIVGEAGAKAFTFEVLP
nr:hypothetical protein [Micromonospora provocatoris]